MDTNATWRNPLREYATLLSDANGELKELHHKQVVVLQSLRHAESEALAQQGRVSAKEKELTEKERKLNDREKSLDQRQGRLDEREANLAERACEIVQSRTQLQFISEQADFCAKVLSRVHFDDETQSPLGNIAERLRAKQRDTEAGTAGAIPPVRARDSTALRAMLQGLADTPKYKSRLPIRVRGPASVVQDAGAVSKQAE